MSEVERRLTGSTWDVEHLLSDALRPIEPPERLSGRVEDTSGRGHPGRRRGALATGPRSSPRASCVPCAIRATGSVRSSRSAPVARPPGRLS